MQLLLAQLLQVTVAIDGNFNLEIGSATSLNAYSVDSSTISMVSTGSATFAGGTVTFVGNNSSVQLRSPANGATLTNQPTGATALAIATTKYVDDATAGSEMFNEAPAVTGGSTDVSLANTPTVGTLRVYLNGIRQAPTDDYSLSGTTVTFVGALTAGDKIIVDYKYV